MDQRSGSRDLQGFAVVRLRGKSLFPTIGRRDHTGWNLIDSTFFPTSSLSQTVAFVGDRINVNSSTDGGPGFEGTSNA
jgi:hypothetical protein